MLLQFRFSNFRSFRDEQTLSMVAGSFKELAETVRHPGGVDEGVLPVAAVYGANASGKSNVILALEYMSRAVRNSHARWEPNAPIERDAFAAGSGSPSTFAVDLLLDGTRYQYGFSMTSEAVIEEWLNAFPNGKKQRWFNRRTGQRTAFSAKLHGDNRTIERLTRPNSLFLSAAAQNNHAALCPIQSWFKRVLSTGLGDREAIHPFVLNLCTFPTYRQKLEELLSKADLGITEVRVEERGVPERSNELVAKWQAAVMAQLKHDGRADLVEDRRSVQFLHEIGDGIFPLNEAQESRGTIAFMGLAGPILRVLDEGAIICVDELDGSLHPLLATELIRMFSDPARNPKSAQLIFNTHDTNLLSAGVLRRDQIWFTEKGRDGASQLYPLTDFKPRKEENLENGYLQGRYGAIPFLNPNAFLASWGDMNEEA